MNVSHNFSNSLFSKIFLKGQCQFNSLFSLYQCTYSKHCDLINIRICLLLDTSWWAWRFKNFEEIIFLAYVTPRLPMSVHKKCKPIRSSRLAAYREHIYECLVLLYRYIICILDNFLIINWIVFYVWY